MKSFIRKWGNSQGVRLSKDILDNANLKCNDEVDITVEGAKIVITKRRYTNLQDRLESFYGKPLDEIYIQSDGEQI